MKSKTVFFRMAFPFLILLSMLHILTITGFAAELRDNRLPSAKGYPYYQSPTQTQAVSPDDLFREKVKSLKVTQRKRLKKNFQKKLKAAATAEEKAYYGNLISIIDECGTK